MHKDIIAMQNQMGLGLWSVPAGSSGCKTTLRCHNSWCLKSI